VVFPPAPPELIGERFAILSLGDLVTSLEKSDRIAAGIRLERIMWCHSS